MSRVQRAWYHCDCLSVRVRWCISKLLVKYSCFACKRPWASLLVSLLFLLVSLPGFALFDFYTGETAHYLAGSYGVDAHNRANEQFDFRPGSTAIFLYFTAKDGKNLFSPQSLQHIGKAMDKILALKTPIGQGINDLCERSWRGKCEFESVFHSLRDSGLLMAYNETSFGEMEVLAGKVGSFCSNDVTSCRKLLEPQERFLIVTSNMNAAGPVEVQSLIFIIYLDPEQTDGYKAFQKIVLEEVHGPSYHRDKDNLQTDDFYTSVFSRYAVDQEGARPASAEYHLMGLTIILTLVFVCCSIVSPTAPRTRILLSLSCMLIVVLSLACAIAISGYVQVPFTSVSSLVIFALFGVAVDDIIVIVHCYDRIKTDKSIEDRLIESLQESGTAITLTSTTSLAAFTCAATCPVPAVRYFCVTAALGILCVYVLQITMFLPLFCLDEHRREARRRECCLSLCCGIVAEPAENKPDGNTGTFHGKVLQCFSAPSVGGGCGIMETYATIVSNSRLAQGAIVAFFFLITALGIFGAVKADTEADLTDYYVDTSFIKKYFDMRETLWSSSGPIYLHIEHQGEGLFSQDRKADINDLFRDLAGLESTSLPTSNWLHDFDLWINLTSHTSAEAEASRARLQGNAVAFGRKVEEFLNVTRIKVPGSEVPLEPWRHKKDVVFKDGQVKHSRLQMRYDSDFKVQATYVKNWKTVYDLFFPIGHREDDLSKGGRVENVWVYSGMAPVAERDRDMKGIIFFNLGIACAAVAIVIGIMLNPLVGFFVGVLVMALDAMVLALLTLYGTKLDFVAFLCLSMTIGLVVDYATHTSHAYLHHQGTPNEKLYVSIKEMGSSVLSGGGSSLLGISVLSFASSKGFRNFFYVLGTAIFMGTAVGIVISPVLLRFLHGLGIVLDGGRRRLSQEGRRLSNQFRSSKTEEPTTVGVESI